MALTAGSIAFLGYDADGTQRFAIVAVDNIPGGTQIFITDRAWNGSSFQSGNSEGTITWTVPSGGIASGTVLSFDNVDSNSLTIAAEKGGVTVSSLGTVSRTGGFDLEKANEVLFAYTGSINAPSTFLAAIGNGPSSPNTGGNAFGSTSDGVLTGTGLVAGQTAVNLAQVDGGADFAVYRPTVGGTTFPSRTAMLNAINNPANWLTGDTSADDSSGRVPFLTSSNSPIENVNFIIDTTPPAPPVFVPGDQHTDLIINGAEASNGETFKFTAEVGSTVKMTFTGTAGSIGPLTATAVSPGVYTVSLTPAQLASLGQGNFTISATATDAVGNISGPGTGSVTQDTAAPAAPVFVPGDQHGDGVINGAEAGNGETFTFTAEPGATVSVSFAGASGSVGPLTATENTSAPGTYTVSLTAPQLASLGDGAVSVSATATDAAGNVSLPGTGSVTQDTAAPAAPVFVPGDQHGAPDFTITPGETSGGETFTFTAEPGATVLVSFAGTLETVGPLTATEDPDAPGTYTVNLTAQQLNDLGQGQLSISATATDAAGNTSLPSNDAIDIIPCFLPGTLIATPSGPAAVETLAPGDLVLTADGRAVAVRFIGRRTVMPRFAGAEAANPIRIAAGALAENVPARDLFVSPNHGIVVDGVLTFASALVNGSTIAQVDGPGPRFAYYSIETEAHEVILAENCPAETFMDHVPRSLWENHADYLALHPDEPRIAEMDLPHAKSHRQVPAEIHARIAERAAALALSAAA